MTARPLFDSDTSEHSGTSPASENDAPKTKRRRRRRSKKSSGGQSGSSQNEHLHQPPPAKEVAKLEDLPVEVFDVEQTFSDIGLRDSVVEGCTHAGFACPTHIQAQLIPMILSGTDVIGQAKTGTGKTAAFGLPMLHLCEREPEFQALILAPTRELALQIATEINDLGMHTPIKAVPIYGGARIGGQADRLKRKPQIVVGTPGRIKDMVDRGLLHFDNVRYMILDEVDRMLDIGFREDIRKILKMCPSATPDENGNRRQTIFVSATLSPEIEKLAKSFMHEPKMLHVQADSLTVQVVKQHHLLVEPWDKRRMLRHLLTHEEPAMTLVFCKLKRKVDELVKYLKEKDIAAEALHGDMSQSRRETIMHKLRRGSLGVLVASDLVSRGIDVEGITHVVNFDLPEDIELYVHRIGRTARAGRDGVAWTFVTPEEGEHLTEIEKLINAEIPRLEYPDFQPGPMPDVVARERAAEEAKKEQAKAKSRLAENELPSKDAADPSKFPGGVVPTKMPGRMMRGKIRGRR
ncbi:MAG: DEAD/DEAH box helicase [Phycisphaeraceae bacterium]|nr:DEAD/DEAH box helicase [Phycisphaerales bacterium]MCB9860326.1 DEAD/DEAH box helicase [Phycisphaeraceae bacterium]